jgi:hypothetical protein
MKLSGWNPLGEVAKLDTALNSEGPLIRRGVVDFLLKEKLARLEVCDNSLLLSILHDGTEDARSGGLGLGRLSSTAGLIGGTR